MHSKLPTPPSRPALVPDSNIPRKIIGISAIPATETHSHGVLALCDDGTVWTNYLNQATEIWGSWEPLPAIPQDGAE